MRRGLVFVAAVTAALALAWLTGLPPAPRDAAAPGQTFAAARATIDVRAISRAPHPTGSPEAARVRAYLMERLQGLGLEVETQAVPLSARARERLRLWGEPDAARAEAVNVLARLPGPRGAGPGVALMAHYDSVAGSPGAADDAAGVAAILEAVRAIQAGGPRRRDLYVVLTDAEELQLDGARAFFAQHPWAAGVGAVVNLEARGGGGRALMFETGPGNGAMADLFARAAPRPSAQSLAVLIYRMMPNSSDFTVAKDRGLPGFNFAFMGRAGLYHSRLANADALSQRSLQHLGSQALAVTRALLEAERLPARAPDAVFSDVLGLTLIAYPVWAGWLPLCAAAGLLAAAAVLCSRRQRPDLTAALTGAARALALLPTAVLALDAFNRLSGAGPTAGYFDRLAALPRLEAQAVVVALGVMLLVFGRLGRRAAAAPFALAAVDVALGGVPIPLAILAVVAGAALFAAGLRDGDRAWEWLGALVLLFLAAVAVQVAAPTATPLFSWPLLAASAAAAVAAALDPRLGRTPAVGAVAVAGAVAAAQVLGMAHLAFLGVGADLAAAMAVFVLLTALVLWPLIPRLTGRSLAVAGAVAVLAAGGLALSVRLDPPAASAPAFAR